jgi:rubrerythrin
MKIIEVSSYKRAKAGGIYKTVSVKGYKKIPSELHDCFKCKTETMHRIRLEIGEKESHYTWKCKICGYPNHSVLPANIDWELEENFEDEDE